MTGLACPALAAERPAWAVVLHGGAGVIERAKLDPALEEAYRKGLTAALNAATTKLAAGAPALDAIEAAIQVLEDDPLFNAGRGAVFTAAGKNELDAAIMDGSNLKAGAVAGITRIKHPISLARAVMEKSPHVMLIGEGAEQFGKEAGLEQVDPSWFFTERRWQGLAETLKKQGVPMPERPAGAPPAPQKQGALPVDDIATSHKFGTVGVVALDTRGNIAAGTSTGGVSGKKWGRVGDVPIIGAGTYANNESCAVSATGAGEYFIRLGVAREICNLVKFKSMTLQAAADEVVQKQVPALGGDGGVVAITRDGQLAWSFNTSGMYRAKQVADGTAQIGIFKDEK
ncbi:isoaspartyl peptidase/L-asparaginase [Rhodospirillales bacterium TMPK1]|uniref:Isoaspartyl peptidase n=2 Tax=Roseiterribacter gracilis TaxID=2812848 RepID=A0A8S8XIZ7_9PROT|nr:isoaspartyl peptidase/L-asparaginase [Rhodospirillales bacterium TMPK1]